MIKSTFQNEVVERSARTARDRLSLKHTHLRKAEAKYAEASSNRGKREELVARAMAELLEAKKTERRRKARRDKLRLRYSEVYLNYQEVLQAAGLTEAEIKRYFGDLVPATLIETFTEKKASA